MKRRQNKDRILRDRHFLHRAGIKILKAPIHLYRYLLSPWIGSQCRFYPTCSVYALQALEHKGIFRGVFLIARRLLLCHPWSSKSGYDPVPDVSGSDQPSHIQCGCDKEHDQILENKI